MSGGLAPSDFASFYEEVHCKRPFDWQEELAQTVCRSGWPRYLDMPTASGKTSVMDIAVFHLAMEGRRAGRTAPLRIAFVVDRRLVVDGAYGHARRIACKINGREGEVVGRVADGLGSFSDGLPLEVARLRGGMPRDDDWALTPSQPTVIVSTVDQVGSRLLFRGYGVSDSMRPVHAGLLGTDTLILLDEAHTSRPFLDTLDQIAGMRGRLGWDGDLPFACMFMSATHGGGSGRRDVFPPAESRDALLRGDGAIRPRFEASKPARLVEAPAGRGDVAMMDAALEMAYPKKADAGALPHNIGIVVNRVDMARRMHRDLCERLRREHGEGAKAHLLIGRARPLVRDLEVGAWISGIVPGGEKACCRGKGGEGGMDPGSGHGTCRPDEDEGGGGKGEEGPVMFFVATQCIEVGVDADFDALVTQIAPLDSLRQRFGRLNRVGARPVSSAAIVATREEMSSRYVDPVYGDAVTKAWRYLVSASTGKRGRMAVDFGVENFPMHDGYEDAAAPRARSVSLMPSYVSMWAQTSPRPVPDPDPGPFLHGAGTRQADVQIVWRADVTDELLQEPLDMDMLGLTTCKPSALEAVSLPVWVARRWLARGSGGDYKQDQLCDIEGVAAPAAAATGGGKKSGARGAHGAHGGEAGRKCAVRWRGARSAETVAVTAADVQAGDTLVVPASRGGCDKYGWDEGRSEAVIDIGMEANLFHRHAFTMRLGRPYLLRKCEGNAADEIEVLSRDIADDDAEAVLAALAKISGIPAAWSKALAVPRGAGSVRLQRANAGGGVARIAGIRIDLAPDRARGLIEALYPSSSAARDIAGAEGGDSPPSTEEDGDGGDARTRAPHAAIGLADHCRGVGKMVKKFCERIGMEEGLRGDLALAGYLHDAGKAERRVQALWRGLDPDDVPDGAEETAKSIVDLSGRDRYRRYRQLARLPEKYRHECWSVRLAERHPAVNSTLRVGREQGMRSAHDGDLVLYVIGTHHGYGRPLFPPVVDEHAAGSVEWSFDGVRMVADSKHLLERLDSGWIEMWDGLYRRYGPWRLAHMEAVVRLADHRVSGGGGG